MGLFDFFKKKNQKPESPQPIVERRVVPETQKQEPEVVPQNAISQEAVKNVAIATTNTAEISKNVRLHSDLAGLVWIGDGKFKNYTDSQNNINRFEIGGLAFTLSFGQETEPSLIFTSLPVKEPSSIESVDRPPYFPSYSGLTPEQRFIYLRLLNNPYDASIDIGYVFILYYGLERHLLQGDFDKAFNVILKLRDVHRNKSFQSYSANALILSTKIHERGEMIIEFLNSLDKDWEYNFSDNLLLLCYYSFNLPITPAVIMRMAKTFEFNNTNYIKKYPDVFERCLRDVLIDNINDDKVFLTKYFTKTELKKIKTQDIPVFANMSIRSKSIPVPLLSEEFKLKRDMSLVLEQAHELAKAVIADNRKKGSLIEAVKPVEKKKPPVQDSALDKADVAIKRHKFDRNKIHQGDFTYDDFSSRNNLILKKHFDCIEDIRENYARRKDGVDFLKKAVNACKEQIDISAEAAYWLYAEGDFERKQIEQEYGMTPIEHWRKIRAESGLPIDEEHDPCGMPEHTGYKQLCIICEKQGFWDEVINIAEQAKEEGWRGDWDKRIEKAQKNLDKLK
jgi:hypothetical protein